MAPAVKSFIDLPPWPTGWTDWKVTVTTREIPGNPRLEQLAKQGGLRFSGIYHGDAIFRLDDVFFAANILWRVFRFACDGEGVEVYAESVASLKDLAELLAYLKP